jgi:hypothetical protein
MKIQLIAVPIDDIEHPLQSRSIDGATPVNAYRMLHGSRWWQQSAGVLRVRNGFSVQGILAIPQAGIDAAGQPLLQASK